MQGDARVVYALLEEVLLKLHEIAIRELKRERYVAPLSKTELIQRAVWNHSYLENRWGILRDRACSSLICAGKS